jgi:hypothetical protein
MFHEGIKRGVSPISTFWLVVWKRKLYVQRWLNGRVRLDWKK